MATIQELEALFDLQDETLSTEFKAWLDLTTPHGKATVAKSVIAMANHGGGTVLMGMGGKPPASTERPAEIARYTADMVNAAVNRYADPKISCEVAHLDHPETGFEHAFILVPGGASVPVMAVKELPGTIAQQRCYIRKPGPKSEEPFTAEEWRALLDRCVRANRDNLLDAIRQIVQGQPITQAAQEQIDRLLGFTDESRERWQSRIEPLPKDDPARFKRGFYEQSFQVVGVEPAANLMELRDRLYKAGETKLTGWGPFVCFDRPPIGPTPAGDAIEAWIGHPDEQGRDGRHSDFWRVNRAGCMYEIRSHDEDYTEKAVPGTILDLTIPIWRIGETLLHVARFARLFGEDPEIAYRIEYTGLKGRKMKSIFSSRYLSYERECVVDSVLMQGKTQASVLDDNIDEVLLQLLTPLYEAFSFAPLNAPLVSGELAKFRNSRF
jgi:hypothetical protein